MPRVNLSISDRMYDAIKKDADTNGVSVNNIIHHTLQDKYGTNEFDYIRALNRLIKEARKQESYFNLYQLKSFKEIDSIVKDSNISESPEQIRARLGKMFSDAVQKGLVWDVETDVVETKDGELKARTSSRATVYKRN